jgi:TetR/AcrR family transcriptional regulator, fatty acid metabolism regulator protein
MSNHSPGVRRNARKGERAVSTTRERANENKRERILDAAVKVFAAEGFYAAKVSQIAAEAGVADGTIYLYFKSKDELLINLFEDRMERVLATLRAALAGSGPSAVDRLRRVIELHLDLIEQNPAMGEVITVELRQSAKFIREYDNPKFAEFLRLIAGAIADGQARGELRAELDPQLTARALFGALDEIALSWIVRAEGKARGNLQHAARQLGTLFLDGLRAPPLQAPPHSK